MPDKPTTLFNAWRCIKSLPVPVKLCATSFYALFKFGTIVQEWAGWIWQRLLEGSKQVVKTPCYDHVVVHSHKQANNNTGISKTTKVRVYCIPYSNRSLTQTLTNCQLKEEKRDSQKEQTQEVGNQKGTWKYKEKHYYKSNTINEYRHLSQLAP